MLSTLIELQRLKRLDRTGWTLRGLPNGTESVAAHSFGVGVTAMLLADKFNSRGISVDVEKVLRLALLHDWAEVRVGDMPRTATLYFGSEARKQAETAAFSDLVSDVDSAQGLYGALYRDYEQRSSLEARLVKRLTCSIYWSRCWRSSARARVASTSFGKLQNSRNSTSRAKRNKSCMNCWIRS